eukprot:15726-Ditylum_brightwellii.AAC.1
MKKAKEEMKDGRMTEDEFNSAIEVEEAVWAAAEEAKQKQWDQALKEEEDLMYKGELKDSKNKEEDASGGKEHKDKTLTNKGSNNNLKENDKKEKD